MQYSGIPPKIPLPFAASAGAPYIRTIPVPSQIGVQNGAASFTDGFPPNSFIPIAAGGSWPWGKDFNGLLFQITSGLQWLQAGAPLAWDPAFSVSIGGYPNGAVIQSATTIGFFWRSIADNNLTNPDTGGANWVPFQQTFNIQTALFTGSSTFTVPVGVRYMQGEAWGGGAGGGSGNGTFGGSGGGAGLYDYNYFSVVPGQILTINIGSGGLGSNIAGNAGLPGGATTIIKPGPITVLLAGGGGGGPTGGGVGGIGGTANIGAALAISGQGGFVSQQFGQGGAPGGSCSKGGFGGQPGNTGGNPGGGGAGNQFNNALVGSNGGSGQVFLSWVA